MASLSALECGDSVAKQYWVFTRLAGVRVFFFSSDFPFDSHFYSRWNPKFLSRDFQASIIDFVIDHMISGKDEELRRVKRIFRLKKKLIFCKTMILYPKSGDVVCNLDSERFTVAS